MNKDANYVEVIDWSRPQLTAEIMKPEEVVEEVKKVLTEKLEEADV